MTTIAEQAQVEDHLSHDEALELLRQRRDAYAFLSSIYGAEASIELLELLSSQMTGRETSAQDDGYEALRAFFETTGAGDLSAVRAELAADYARLFLAASQQPVPPYESVYTSTERLLMQEAYDEVVTEYLAEGLGRIQDWLLPEDHIALELEFMAHLCRKTEAALVSGDAQSARISLQKQKTFLEKHLLVWIPEFCVDVRRKAHTGFYQAIAQITAEHLSYENEAIADLIQTR